MALTLTQARNLVRQLLDDSSTDTEEQRWSDSEIDLALEAGQEEVLLTLLGRHAMKRTEVALSSGVADLSSLQILRLDAVELKTGQVYTPLDQATGMDGGDEPAIGGTVRVTYLGKPTFPASASDPLFAAGALPFSLAGIERVVCLRAAQHLLPKDADVNRALDISEASLRAALASLDPVGARELVAVGSPRFSEDYAYVAQLYGYRYRFDPATGYLHMVG